MSQPATERACDRCRERRVKCDKRQPACLRCEKLGKPCPGYDKKRKFVDEGVGLRKKYHAPDSGGAAGDFNFQTVDFSISSPISQKATKANHQDSPVSQKVPKTSHQDSPRFASSSKRAPVTSPLANGEERITSHAAVSPPTSAVYGAPAFGNSIGTVLNQTSNGLNASQINTTPSNTGPAVADPLLFPTTPFIAPTIEDHGMDELWTETAFDPEWFNLEPDAFYAKGNNSCGFIPNLPNIVDEVDKQDLGFQAKMSTTPLSTFSSLAGGNTWDPERQLITSALITDEREHEMAYLIRHFTESIGPWMDLFDKEEHFAHLVPLKALRDALLRNAIAAVAAKQLGRVKGKKPFFRNQHQKPAAMETIEDLEIDWFYKAANYYDKAITFSRVYLQALSGSLSNPPTPGFQATLSTANSDDLLVAVSIFSLYESLDNLEMGWFQHLAGLKSLLSAVGTRQHDQGQLMPSITIGRQASFWNFARADYQAAYINHQKTLLDTEDMELWQSCGLQIQPDGSLYANPPEIKNDPLHCRSVAQLVSHTLLWLVLRVANYIASDQDQLPVERQSNWDLLTQQLDMWFADLPDTFQPCAQMKYPLSGSSEPSQLTEVFFSINQCAAAIQLYHFARILLLLNKPNTGVGLSRLKAYREASAEAIKHARLICGIALGRPHPAVRVEMLLPLYIAGTCLEANQERQVVLDLLKAIEKDTGCATEAKVRSLVDEWGWKEPAGQLQVV